MKRVVLGGVGLLALAVLVALLLRPDRRVWDPFQHVGPAFSSDAPDADRYEGYRKRTRYLELADGTRLAADMFLPVAPIVYEDGHGELVDEIPEMGEGDPTTFLDDGDPSYADGAGGRRNLIRTPSRDSGSGCGQASASEIPATSPVTVARADGFGMADRTCYISSAVT